MPKKPKEIKSQVLRFRVTEDEYAFLTMEAMRQSVEWHKIGNSGEITISDVLRFAVSKFRKSVGK